MLLYIITITENKQNKINIAANKLAKEPNWCKVKVSKKLI